MNHYIIVKWKDMVIDKSREAEKVRELFGNASEISGIRQVAIRENVTPRNNRYDLMIVINMEPDALTVWDESDLHKQWKARYGEIIESKAIFDSDDF